MDCKNVESCKFKKRLGLNLFDVNNCEVLE